MVVDCGWASEKHIRSPLRLQQCRVEVGRLVRGIGRAHTVSFHMMVLDMVVVIGVPRMSHQRLQHVRERFVKPSPATVQYT